jgi:acyl dehydratase
MKLLVESELRIAGGLIGAGFDELRWPKPVRPGDEPRVHSEVLEVRRSRSRPTQGMVKVRITTLDQNDEAVQVSVSNMVVPCRSWLVFPGVLPRPAARGPRKAAAGRCRARGSG